MELKRNQFWRMLAKQYRNTVDKKEIAIIFDAMLRMDDLFGVRQ